MAKTVDISKYINADEPEFTLFGKTYKVKNDKKTVLLLNAMQNKLSADDTSADLKILKLLLGEEKAVEIMDVLDETPNYVKNEQAVMINIMALATGEEYEDLLARFQKKQQG